jgi:DcmR-like sensory protein
MLPESIGVSLANFLDLGIRGVEAALGDHICGLYAGAKQRDALLFPFLEAGLLAGDKCICVVDATEPSLVIDQLSANVDARTRADAKQLDVMRAADLYLRSGSFSAAEVISLWKSAMSEVMYDNRFDVVRAVETWSMQDVQPDLQELYRLESEMNRFLPLYPQVILCLYDVEQFGGGIVVNLLRTHPKVLLGGMVVENPYFQMPEELIAVSGGPDDMMRAASEGLPNAPP